MFHPKMAEKIKDRLKPRENMTHTIQLPISNEFRSRNVKEVQIRKFHGIEKSKIQARNKILQEKISRLEPQQANNLKMQVALKHLKEQREKGHMIKTDQGEEKGPNFEPHVLPEINSILYNFEFDRKKPFLTM